MHESMYDEELKAFRDSFVKFLDKEVKPHHAQWEADGQVSRADDGDTIRYADAERRTRLAE